MFNNFNLHPFLLLKKVTQVYISWLNTPNAPIRQLVGVDRQHIAPAEVINVSILTNDCDIEGYDDVS